MKSDLFGGDWEGYIHPVNDHFGNLISQIQNQGAHAELARMPVMDDDGTGAMVWDAAIDAGNPPPPSAPDAAAIPATDAVMASFSGPMQPADLALAAMTASSAPGQGVAPPIQPAVFHPAVSESGDTTAPAVASSPMAAPDSVNAGRAGSMDAPASALNPYPGIDYGVIARHEGSRLDPYVPPGSSSSGVTVATGVDLSEHTAAELRDWGVSEDTIAKLSPFLKPDGKGAMGLKGDAAQTALTQFQKDNPASGDLPRYEINLSDALAMNNGALKNIAGQVQQAYDAANPPVPFLQLPAPTRTAILDLAYQYGPALAARAPAFWHAATAGDWDGAADELHNWTATQRADPTAQREPRRLDEEALIRSGTGGLQPTRQAMGNRGAGSRGRIW